jgi:hypothetical protein
MRPVGHRPATQTRCRFAADAVGAPPAATRNRTIATCCDAVARQTLAQPAQSRLRPPNTKRPNTHSDRGTASRAFLPFCRLPDAGPGTRGIAREGRHPEPSTRNPQHDLPSSPIHAMSVQPPTATLKADIVIGRDAPARQCECGQNSILVTAAACNCGIPAIKDSVANGGKKNSRGF